MKTPSLVLRSAIIAALGGLLFGFDTAVISGTVKSLESVFQLDKWLLGFTVSSALFGTILGAATAQFPSNRFGRKPTLIAMAVFFFVSAVGSAWPEMLAFGDDRLNWLSFLFFRFIGGVGIGAASVVSPLYTAEISPAKSRGLLVGLTQFNIVFGILLAFFSNYAISIMPFGDNAWRWMFGVEAIPAAAFFFLLFSTPESPRWLITKGRIAPARDILNRLGTDSGDTDREIEIIQQAVEAEQSGGREVFFSHRLRFPIMLAICIAAFNQLSGINAILYYAPTIFEMTGASEQLAMFLPVIIGLTNLVFTMAALAVIDRFGRRTLMFVGSLGYIASMAIVATTFLLYAPQFKVAIANYAVTNLQKKSAEYRKNAGEADEANKDFWNDRYRDSLTNLILATEDSQNAAKRLRGDIVAENQVLLNEMQSSVYTTDQLQLQADERLQSLDLTPIVSMQGILIVLGGLMFFIASHAFGSGACIWTFIGEIFPNKTRAQGQALGSFTHWVLNAVVSSLFPPLLGLIGPSAIFYGFSGLMVLQLLWVIFLMPETKQVPLEEMQRKLGITE
ncbi:MAG: sugar porter family MFS transporter [Planctomycetaceae bacterium]|nr:sugar porter family MFS transporter [Planctomycetaceae bacterium]